jgi:hypothetical protein
MFFSRKQKEAAAKWCGKPNISASCLPTNTSAFYITRKKKGEKERKVFFSCVFGV